MITPSNSISCRRAAWFIYDVREEWVCVCVCVCVCLCVCASESGGCFADFLLNRQRNVCVSVRSQFISTFIIRFVCVWSRVHVLRLAWYRCTKMCVSNQYCVTRSLLLQSCTCLPTWWMSSTSAWATRTTFRLSIWPATEERWDTRTVGLYTCEGHH